MDHSSILVNKIVCEYYLLEDLTSFFTPYCCEYKYI